ncbi:MAG: KpsF/GutQ family sugar-phosphate isomerase [Desulfovibrionaceae bacterium]|nr:KpsF/GutQ family sugar-phosphate isomerase [Desulfovibrionaceae bacterium]
MTQNTFDIIAEAQRVRDVTRDALDTLIFDDVFIRVVEHISKLQGSLFFLGVGKSGIIGKKLAATFASLGFPAFFIHPTEALHGDMGRISPHDTVIALSYSGSTAELLEALQSIEKRDITLIVITGNPSSPLAQRAMYALIASVPSEACPWNIVPTTSLIATMIIGDALALCAVQVKKLTKEHFARNHPKGALGALLYNMVEQIMQKDELPLVFHSSNLKEALHVLHTHNDGAVFIVDEDKKIEGVLTDGDIRRLIINNSLDLEESITHYMNPNPKVGGLTMTTAELLDIMERNAITVLPIVDNDNVLQGILHIHDILGRGAIPFH